VRDQALQGRRSVSLLGGPPPRPGSLSGGGAMQMPTHPPFVAMRSPAMVSPADPFGRMSVPEADEPQPGMQVRLPMHTEEHCTCSCRNVFNEGHITQPVTPTDCSGLAGLDSGKGMQCLVCPKHCMNLQICACCMHTQVTGVVTSRFDYGAFIELNVGGAIYTGVLYSPPSLPPGAASLLPSPMTGHQPQVGFPAPAGASLSPPPAMLPEFATHQGLTRPLSDQRLAPTATPGAGSRGGQQVQQEVAAVQEQRPGLVEQQDRTQQQRAGASGTPASIEQEHE
jgi:hypothetical protein